MWDRSWLKPRTLDSRFQPSVGRPFEMEEVPVLDGQARALLPWLIGAGAGAAVVVTGLHGMATGRYVEIELVWAVVGPLFGALLAHGFGSAGTNSR